MKWNITVFPFNAASNGLLGKAKAELQLDDGSILLELNQIEIAKSARPEYGKYWIRMPQYAVGRNNDEVETKWFSMFRVFPGKEQTDARREFEQKVMHKYDQTIQDRGAPAQGHAPQVPPTSAAPIEPAAPQVAPSQVPEGVNFKSPLSDQDFA